MTHGHYDQIAHYLLQYNTLKHSSKASPEYMTQLKEYQIPKYKIHFKLYTQN